MQIPALGMNVQWQVMRMTQISIFSSDLSVLNSGCQEVFVSHLQTQTPSGSGVDRAGTVPGDPSVPGPSDLHFGGHSSISFCSSLAGERQFPK